MYRGTHAYKQYIGQVWVSCPRESMWVWANCVTTDQIMMTSKEVTVAPLNNYSSSEEVTIHFRSVKGNIACCYQENMMQHDATLTEDPRERLGIDELEG